MAHSTKLVPSPCPSDTPEASRAEERGTPSPGANVRSLRRLRFAGAGGRLGLGLCLLAGMLAATPTAKAQANSRSLGSIGFGGTDNSPHTPPVHMVQGTVQDKDGKPVLGAIVHVKNAKRREVDLVVVDDKGAYRFSPLAADTDYEVWAQVGEKKGPSRPISSFTTGPVTLQLKME